MVTQTHDGNVFGYIKTRNIIIKRENIDHNCEKNVKKLPKMANTRVRTSF